MACDRTLRKAGFALLLALLPVAASAETMTREVPGVTRVQFKVPGELVVRAGDRESLTVEAEPQVLEALDIGVRGDTLSLGAKGNIRTERKLLFTLTLKALRSLRNDGSGSALVENFGGPAIELRAGGSGDIRARNVRPETLQLSVPGSGTIEASGSGKAVQARLDGSGAIDAAAFRAQSADADIKGSGDIRVYAEETLKASISGAGSIGYKGRAKVRQSVTGAGSVGRL